MQPSLRSFFWYHCIIDNYRCDLRIIEVFDDKQFDFNPGYEFESIPTLNTSWGLGDCAKKLFTPKQARVIAFGASMRKKNQRHLVPRNHKIFLRNSSISLPNFKRKKLYLFAFIYHLAKFHPHRTCFAPFWSAGCLMAFFIFWSFWFFKFIFDWLGSSSHVMAQYSQ